VQITGTEIDIGKTVADSLWNAANFVARRRRSVDDHNERTARSIEKLHGAIEARLKPAIEALPRSAAEGFLLYVTSGEFQTAIRQVFALRMLHGSANLAIESKPVGATIASALRTYLKRVPIEFSGTIQQVIVDACNEFVAENGRSLEALLRDPMSLAYLRSQESTIGKMVDVFADADPLDSFIRFIDTYRETALDAYSKVRAPHWDAQVVVPLKRVYIPARLLKDGSKLSVSHTEAIIDRTVVVGDPGAGKTTLTTHLAYSILAGRDKRYKQILDGIAVRFEPSTLPFVITLRDFSTKESAGRFEENIIDGLKARFHSAAPKGAIEYLLLAGRACVIFDGLDELLDTSLRRRITQSIEGFAASYPNVRIMVTSRIVGYDQAPLDPDTFTVYAIEPFTDKDVDAYSRAWFTLEKWTSEPGNPHERHKAFMQTSRAVADLRTNPLLLALLCNLYKATGYQDLPRSRPAVLEKCALMLFDRWDRHRSIGTVDFERDFQPVVAWLAFAMFSDQAFARGAPEAKLIRLAVEFLFPARMESEDHAIVFARSLLDHCRGRAWVLTDVGTTAAGEPIYQFTHRTFMEYYAALHIFRRNRTPEGVYKALRDQIASAEWGLVPILAVQIMSRWLDNAADDFLAELLRSQHHADTQVANSLIFGLEVLRTVVVGPAAVRSVVERCVEFMTASGAMEADRMNEALKKPVLSDNQQTFNACCAQWYAREESTS
jgi:hypothetical protein